MKNRLLLLLLFSVFSLVCFPRAGGAAGNDDESSTSSSVRDYSSSDDDNDTKAYTESEDTGPSVPDSPLQKWVKLIFGILFGVFLIFVFINMFSGFAKEKKEDEAIRAADKKFKTLNTGFNDKEFKAKVKTAFIAIQTAWQNQDLGGVRNWVSDGVYQRYSMQIEMMRQLKQINKLSNINIEGVHIVSNEIESDYSIITAMITFNMDDEFICETMPELNESHKGDTATEYWTFIKKTGPVKANLYTSNSCPNCGNELNKNSGEVSKCRSCDTITYLGEYDWVLSDITQKNVFDEDQRSLDPLSQELKELRLEETFCIQGLEDKVGNAFIHYLTAKALSKPELLNRFATDEVMKSIITEQNYLYNRLFVTRITCNDYRLIEDKHQLKFKIAYGAQRVRVNENKVEKIDKEIKMSSVFMTLSRNKGANTTKAKHWSYECSSCGNPFEDTTLVTCKQCGTKINSGDMDWIVSKIEEFN